MNRTPFASGADLDRRVADALATLRARSAWTPEVAFTLGSGLAGALGESADATRIPTAEIPHWPRSTVPGHEGTLILARIAGVPIVALSGRSHRYEGYTLDRVTFGVRVMHALGARVMIFTNAVGAIRPEWGPGDLMLAESHINFIGTRGMLTPEELKALGGGKIPAGAHAPALRAALIEAAREAGVQLRRGTLMGGRGPTYETAAEVRMAARLGADAVCMSTVHEITLAAVLGCEAASLSCVTNLATGLSDAPLQHDEVQLMAGRAAERLRAIFEAYLGRRRPGTQGSQGSGRA